MNINFNNNNTFTSRNTTIRFADNIARKVNKEFPRISASKVENFKNIELFVDFIEDLWCKTSKMRNKRKKEFLTLTNNKDKIRLIFDYIKNFKLGNCKESAELSLLVAKMNGIKNAKIAYLKSPEGFDYDHAVVLVNEKKPYIIDSWLGFADFVPKAFEKYKKDFSECFDFAGSKTEKMTVLEDIGLLQLFLNYRIKKQDLNAIKKEYPNLIL